MKILLAGGKSGGHFYPLIAVAEAINKIAKEENLLDAKLYFMSDSEYDAEALVENDITFIKIQTGKLRRYFSFLNIIDLFRTGIGLVSAFLKVFRLYPDVVFSKGSGASFPVLFAARLLRIPVIIHESDSVPGRANKWAGKFAYRIAVSYPEAEKYFPTGKVALTGNPVRTEMLVPLTTSAHDYLKLETNVPTILILGGSLGSETINNHLLDALPLLVDKYQIVHQVGKQNVEAISNLTKVILTNNPYQNRYRLYDYLNNLNMRMAAGASDLIISRAGSTIFEIASWGVPAIIIPISDSNGDHQRQNAYAYARSGAAVVIEENNLTSHLLVAEINRLFENKDQLEKMKRSANLFFKADAAEKIARELIKVSLSHE